MIIVANKKSRAPYIGDTSGDGVDGVPRSEVDVLRDGAKLLAVVFEVGNGAQNM